MFLLLISFSVCYSYPIPYILKVFLNLKKLAHENIYCPLVLPDVFIFWGEFQSYQLCSIVCLLIVWKTIQLTDEWDRGQSLHKMKPIFFVFVFELQGNFILWQKCYVMLLIWDVFDSSIPFSPVLPLGECYLCWGTRTLGMLWPSPAFSVIMSWPFWIYYAKYDASHFL